MTDTHFRIVFEGQLLQGTSLETAKLNLARLFQSEVSAIDPLFTGQTITLKQGLSEVDAQRYLQALHEAGVQGRIEAEPATSLNLDKIEAVTPAHAPVQPDGFSPYAPPKAQVDEPAGVGELKVFSLRGRIGRLRYLAWSFGSIAMILLASMLSGTVMVLSESIGVMTMLVLCIAAITISIPLGVQRLHDIGWSGWLLLLNLVPIVGSLLPFVMLLVPGNSGANAYGPPPPANSRAVKILASLCLAAIMLLPIFLVGTAITAFQTYQQAAKVTASQNEQSISGEYNSRSARAQGQSL